MGTRFYVMYLEKKLMTHTRIVQNIYKKLRQKIFVKKFNLCIKEVFESSWKCVLQFQSFCTKINSFGNSIILYFYTNIINILVSQILHIILLTPLFSFPKPILKKMS